MAEPNVTNKELKQIFLDMGTKLLSAIADIADVKADVDKKTAVANEIHDRHSNSIERLTEIVEGNGKPGLKTDVANLDGKVDNLSESFKEHKDSMWKWFAPIYIALVGLLFGIVSDSFKSPVTSQSPPPVIVVTATPIPVFREPTMPAEATASPKQRYNGYDDNQLYYRATIQAVTRQRRDNRKPARNIHARR